MSSFVLKLPCVRLYEYSLRYDTIDQKGNTNANWPRILIEIKPRQCPGSTLKYPIKIWIQKRRPEYPTFIQLIKEKCEVSLELTKTSIPGRYLIQKYAILIPPQKIPIQHNMDLLKSDGYTKLCSTDVTLKDLLLLSPISDIDPDPEHRLRYLLTHRQNVVSEKRKDLIVLDRECSRDSNYVEYLKFLIKYPIALTLIGLGLKLVQPPRDIFKDTYHENTFKPFIDEYGKYLEAFSMRLHDTPEGRMILDNPWALCISPKLRLKFETIDKIARKRLGLDPKTDRNLMQWRVAACVVSRLQHHPKGWTMFPYLDIGKDRQDHHRMYFDLCGDDDIDGPRTYESIMDDLRLHRNREIAAINPLGFFGPNKEYVCLDSDIHNEQFIMDFLLHCDKKYHINEPLLDECINKNFKAKGRQIDASQLHALRCMVQNQITFVDGAGGTGKSTLVKTLLDYLRASEWSKLTSDELEEIVISCAPTGKAAVRLTQCLGHRSKTAHSHIFGRMYAPSTKPLELMIVDEVSMLDLLVAGPLLRLASSSHTRIVFTGDNRQLSPPGVGQFSIDLAKFHHKLNVVMCTLTTQHRYKGHIASLCDDLRHHLDRKRSPSGKTDAKETVDLSPHVRPLGDVQYLPYDNTLQKDASDSVIVDRYHLLLTDAVASKQSLIMITYQNETLKRLNPKIQAIVNPLPNQKYVTGFASVFRVNDPVRHLVNWYKKAIANDGITMIKIPWVMNGEIGIVEKVTSSKMEVRYEDGTLVHYTDKSTMNDDITLAYCITVHASQGSEYDNVMFLLDHAWDADSCGADSTLVYTACTRAKKNLLLITNQEIWDTSLRVNLTERNSYMKHTLESL